MRFTPTATKIYKAPIRGLVSSLDYSINVIILRVRETRGSVEDSAGRGNVVTRSGLGKEFFGDIRRDRHAKPFPLVGLNHEQNP